MKAPAFWAPEAGGITAAALTPLAWVYDIGATVRRGLAKRHHAPVPVVCVGNVTAGGAGKTPTAIALCQLMSARGLRPHLLSRGYGGRAHGPLRVDPQRHDASDVGDEPLLLARVAPTWIARDRPAGARAAAAAGATVIVMDDGLQNPSLHKDLSLAVIDGGFGFGNGKVHPAGPLREPVTRAMRRVDALVLIGPDRVDTLRRLPAGHPPVLHADLVPGLEGYEIGERAVVAFAGIGRPAKFFESLEALGCALVACYSFADHHRYTAEEIMTIVEAAHARGAMPVTTEKDFVRLPDEAKPMVRTLSVVLEWRDPATVEGLLSRVIERAHA